MFDPLNITELLDLSRTSNGEVSVLLETSKEVISIKVLVQKNKR